MSGASDYHCQRQKNMSFVISVCSFSFLLLFPLSQFIFCFLLILYSRRWWGRLYYTGATDDDGTVTRVIVGKRPNRTWSHYRFGVQVHNIINRHKSYTNCHRRNDRLDPRYIRIWAFVVCLVISRNAYASVDQCILFVRSFMLQNKCSQCTQHIQLLCVVIETLCECTREKGPNPPHNNNNSIFVCHSYFPFGWAGFSVASHRVRIQRLYLRIVPVDHLPFFAGCLCDKSEINHSRCCFCCYMDTATPQTHYQRVFKNISESNFRSRMVIRVLWVRNRNDI